MKWVMIRAGHYVTEAPERQRWVIRKEPGGWFRFRYLAPVRSRAGPYRTLAENKRCTPSGLPRYGSKYTEEE